MKFPHFLKYILSCTLLAIYIVGLVSDIPDTRNHETIRNLYFHVPMWFGMMVLLTIGFYYSIRYLRTYDIRYDDAAFSFSSVGILYGILGLATGMVWASVAWGSAWNNDPKQLGVAIALLSYFAYLILRRNMRDEAQRARVSAMYNIFAYFILFPTLWILPRMTQSLHPGGQNDQEVAFDPTNLTLNMRLIFWLIAVPTWIGIGYWMAHLQFRTRQLQNYITESTTN